MKREVLADQILRIARECLKRYRIPVDHVEDCATEFLYLKYRMVDLSGPVLQGEEEEKLIVMAEKYAREQLHSLRQRAKKEVSLTGADGTEASGPAGELVSRLSGPEEEFLIKQIHEAMDRALSPLTARQREIYKRLFEEEERAVDLKEKMGCSADALYQARARLRKHVYKLLILAGVDDDAAKTLLNELERLRYGC